MAYLVLQPTITAASTILGYEGHVKYKFRENGCEPSEYKTPFLGQIRQGIQNVFPCQNDKRRALLLPKYIHRESFNSATSKVPSLARLGTILGFLGMLRPHTFSVIQTSSIVLVKSKGKHLISEPDDGKFRALLATMGCRTILALYIWFKSKTMKVTRAYFPNLSHPRTAYSAMCPVEALETVTVQGWITNRFLRGNKIAKAMREFAEEISLSSTKVPMYALRVVDRTDNITQGPG